MSVRDGRGRPCTRGDVHISHLFLPMRFRLIAGSERPPPVVPSLGNRADAERSRSDGVKAAAVALIINEWPLVCVGFQVCWRDEPCGGATPRSGGGEAARGSSRIAGVLGEPA